MKKRNRFVLLAVMILAAVIVFLIIRLTGSGRDTGDENSMTSRDNEVQIVWGDSAMHHQMPEFDRENVKEYAYYGFHEVKQLPLVNFTFDGIETTDAPIVSTGGIPGTGKISGSGSASLTEGRFGLICSLHERQKKKNCRMKGVFIWHTNERYHQRNCLKRLKSIWMEKDQKRR